jgi:repressor LexA
VRFHDLEVSPGEDAAAALGAVLPGAESPDFYRITLTGPAPAMDLEALLAKFPQLPNLELRDRTTAPIDPWKTMGEDSLEGAFFTLLHDAMQTATPEKQQQILAFIEQFSAREGYSPSVREICDATGIRSTSTVHAYLKRLEDDGYIDRRSGLNRAIRLPGENVTRVPLLGRVTAGMHILAVEEVEDYVPFSGGSQYPAGELFALRVTGTSMINAGILDRDVVIVRRCNTAQNGDIVVALIGDEATVKRIFVEKDHIRLQPENDAYEPIIVKEVTVLGKVISLVRYF